MYICHFFLIIRPKFVFYKKYFKDPLVIGCEPAEGPCSPVWRTTDQDKAIDWACLANTATSLTAKQESWGHQVHQRWEVTCIKCKNCASIKLHLSVFASILTHIMPHIRKEEETTFYKTEQCRFLRVLLCLLLCDYNNHSICTDLWESAYWWCRQPAHSQQ